MARGLGRLVREHVGASAASPHTQSTVEVHEGAQEGEVRLTASWFTELEDAQNLLACQGGGCMGVSARALGERDALFARHGVSRAGGDAMA